MRKIIVFLVTSGLLGVLLTTSIKASDYYVSNTGNDTNAGTSSSPFKTFSKAISILVSGDTLYIYGGTYTEKLSLTKAYTSSAPLTIKPVFGQNVVIDGAGNDAPLSITGSYINLEGLEVKGGSPLDCVLIKGKYININKFNVHDCYHFGIRLGGQNIVVENSDVHDNETENVGGTNTSGGWGSGFKGSIGASGNIIHNNRVYHNWGEGIAMTQSGSATIENNLVYDNYSVNIYIDNSFNIDVRRNMTYSTDPTYYRNFSGVKKPANCITIGEENYTGWEYQLANIRILNNIMYHCRNGTGFTYSEGPDGGLNTVLIAYNTVWGSTEYALKIINQPTRTINTTIENNIFGGSSSIDLSTGISYYNNNWSGAVPSNGVGSGDKIGDPKFYINPNTMASSYRLSSSSLAIDSGKAIADVTDDYENKVRDALPDIGAIEYTTTVNTTPTTSPVATSMATPTPTIKQGDANNDGYVNEADYSIWFSHFDQSVLGIQNGNFNGDSKVDGIDYVIWLNNYGK